ncbi:YjbH domain-containing protein, partial [Kaarinaea lacus]
MHPSHSFPHNPLAILSTRCVLLLLACLCSFKVFAEPNQLGQTGLVNMPDARIDDEGTLRFGLSHMQPYSALWASVSFFSWLEMSGRYTEIDNVEAFNRPDTDFGDYKDKAFDAKIRLLKESKYFPQLTIGAQDFLGTQVFEAQFV